MEVHEVILTIGAFVMFLAALVYGTQVARFYKMQKCPQGYGINILGTLVSIYLSITLSLMSFDVVEHSVVGVLYLVPGLIVIVSVSLYEVIREWK
jgi:hypothetical protein